jgi:hypothetical protein
MTTVQAPANIIMAQNTHLQLNWLSTILQTNSTINLMRLFKILDALSTDDGTKHWPEENTGREQAGCSATDSCRPDVGNDPYTKFQPRPNFIRRTSVPPQFVSGATAKKPAKNRVTSSVSIFWARACPRWNSVYAIIVTMKIGRRPTNSLPGPQNKGWGLISVTSANKRI